MEVVNDVLMIYTLMRYSAHNGSGEAESTGCRRETNDQENLQVYAHQERVSDI